MEVKEEEKERGRRKNNILSFEERNCIDCNIAPFVGRNTGCEEVDETGWIVSWPQQTKIFCIFANTLLSVRKA